MRSFVTACAAVLCLAQPAMARDLPVERLFDAPDLQGPALRQMRFSPALSAALLIVGFAAGIGTMYSIVGSRSSSTPQIAESTPSSSPAQASISGIRSIIQEPGSDKVSIKYDATTPAK